MRSMLDSEICYLSIFFSFSVSQGHETVWYCQERNILHLFLFGKHFSDVFITMLPSLDILRYGCLWICLTRNRCYVTTPPTDVSCCSDSLSIIIERVQITQTIEKIQSYLDCKLSPLLYFSFSVYSILLVAAVCEQS